MLQDSRPAIEERQGNWNVSPAKRGAHYKKAPRVLQVGRKNTARTAGDNDKTSQRTGDDGELLRGVW